MLFVHFLGVRHTAQYRRFTGVLDIATNPLEYYFDQ